ncbi:hypothetical protein [Cohnella caldifontis]|uniref:hypothetical protein n=1 Tax=Cohnella caldifontis TaxID=3027471 RepID=UPI0023EDA07C|nr:hypothetical protein [Cohnella sp. YIM B05605]
MRLRIGLTAVLLAAACFCWAGIAAASWAFAFVAYDGKLYEASNEQVAPDRIGPKIGQVTMYSTEETAVFSGNYSNRYPKGTKYFKIKGVDIGEAIAVQESEGIYVNAKYRGVAAGGREDSGAPTPDDGYGPADGRLRAGWVPYVLFVPILLVIAGYGLVRRRNSRAGE